MLKIFGYTIYKSVLDTPLPKTTCAVCRNMIKHEDMHGSRLYDTCKTCGHGGGSLSYVMCERCWRMLTPKQRWPFYEKRAVRSGMFDSLAEATDFVSKVKAHILAGK